MYVVFVLFYRENHGDGKDDGSHIGDFYCNISRFFLMENSLVASGSTVPRSSLEDQLRQERVAQVQAKIRDPRLAGKAAGFPIALLGWVKI